MHYRHRKIARAHYKLGDLILAVGCYSKNNREMAAAVVDLIESGRVRLLGNRRKIRDRLS